METKKIIIYTDGGSRGNPGEAAYGFVVFDKTGAKLYEKGGRLGLTTNNVAEYMAVLRAVEWAENFAKKSPIHIDFYMDSELIASQLAGAWKIKNPMLKSLHTKIHDLYRRLNIHATHTSIPREKNREADRLVNLALDST